MLTYLRRSWAAALCCGFPSLKSARRSSVRHQDTHTKFFTIASLSVSANTSCWKYKLKHICATSGVFFCLRMNCTSWRSNQEIMKKSHPYDAWVENQIEELPYILHRHRCIEKAITCKWTIQVIIYNNVVFVQFQFQVWVLIIDGSAAQQFVSLLLPVIPSLLRFKHSWTLATIFHSFQSEKTLGSPWICHFLNLLPLFQLR